MRAVGSYLRTDARPLAPSPTTDTEGATVADAAHLNIIRDHLGAYYVEVVQGADRITITPPLWNLTEASDALQRIRAATLLPVGRRF